MAKKDLSLTSVLAKYSAEKEDVMISTGILPIDKLLGGGLCPGGMYAFWGPPGSFKSTVALQIVKSYCKRGDKVAFIDVEKALNTNQQEAFGVRQYVEDGILLHITADTYEQADEICMAIASDSELNIKLVVVDSDTQLLPKIGEDADVSSNQPGMKSKQCSVWITKTKAAFFKSGITSIILAHARANLNMQSMYGPQTKMAGGYSIQHVPDAIMQFLPGQKFGDKDKPDGAVIHLSTDKNKFAAPFKRVDVKCFFGKGILKKVCIIDSALEQGIITQSGSFFKLPNGETVRGTQALYDLSSDILRDIQSRLS